MTRQRSRAWGWFAATALPLLAVLAWVTATLQKLDRDEVQARQQAALHEKMRLALWRMDSWLSPQLAREAQRPPAEYRAFPPAAEAWTRSYSKLAPDEVLVQSPLLGAELPGMLLHFEIGADGTITSPQVPLGHERQAAVAGGVDPAILARAELRLAELTPRLQPQAVARMLGAAEALLPMVGCTVAPPDGSEQALQSVNEYSNRAVWNMSQQNGAPAAPPTVRVEVLPGGVGPAVPAPEAWTEAPAGGIGPMVPFWLDGDQPLLALGRRVQDRAGARLQGVVLAWPELGAQMCGLVADLFDTDCVRLVRCEQPTAAQQASMLASVPARLEVELVPAVASGLPTTAMLAITWGVVLLGLGVLGFTLRAAIGYGERRARFASAVTHELRTPLTTFRMYSEMLADGIVQDPAAQKQYLATLQRESERLSRVVENVLAWSRLEEGRFTSRRDRHEVGPLVEGIAPVLRRRLADAEMELAVAIEPAAAGAQVRTDAEAVGQILFNLVDNAAKYARASHGVVELHVGASDSEVRIAVRDHGPGVPAGHRRSVFAPFDRGSVQLSSNEVPGTGLGLPLARGLARDLGGELALDDGVVPGACFVLTLPRA